MLFKINIMCSQKSSITFLLLYYILLFMFLRSFISIVPIWWECYITAWLFTLSQLYVQQHQLVVWNWSSWSSLHHGNWQSLQIRALFPFFFLLSREPFVKHLLYSTAYQDTGNDCNENLSMKHCPVQHKNES